MYNWVSSAYKFAQKSPKAGAYGSQIHGEYEVEPPINFERIQAFLAITERGNEPLLYNPQSRFLPPSAGLVVRREAWLETVPNDSGVGTNYAECQAGQAFELVDL